MKKVRHTLAALAVMVTALVAHGALAERAGAAITPCGAGQTTILNIFGHGNLQISIDGTLVKEKIDGHVTISQGFLSFAHHSTVGGHNWTWSGSHGIAHAQWQCFNGDASWFNQDWWVDKHVVYDNLVPNNYTGPCPGINGRSVFKSAMAHRPWGVSRSMIVTIYDGDTGNTLQKFIDNTNNPLVWGPSVSWINLSYWGDIRNYVGFAASSPDWTWWPASGHLRVRVESDRQNGLLLLPYSYDFNINRSCI